MLLCIDEFKMDISINSTKLLSTKDTIRLCPDMDTRQVVFKL